MQEARQSIRVATAEGLNSGVPGSHPSIKRMTHTARHSTHVQIYTIHTSLPRSRSNEYASRRLTQIAMTSSPSPAAAQRPGTLIFVLGKPHRFPSLLPCPSPNLELTTHSKEPLAQAKARTAPFSPPTPPSTRARVCLARCTTHRLATSSARKLPPARCRPRWRRSTSGSSS